MSKRKKIALVVILLCIILILGIYFAAAGYFSRHFYPGTRINGMDVGTMNAQQVKKQMQDKVREYTLTIHERGDGLETITAAQLEMDYKDDGEIEELIKAQNPWMWVVSMTRKKDLAVDAGRTYNESVIDTLVEQLDCMDETAMVQPQDAKIERTDTGFAIAPETEGNALDGEEVKNAVRQAVSELKSEISLEELGLYKKPSVYGNDQELKSRVDELNRMTAAQITYDFKDRTFTADSKTISAWIVDDGQGGFVLDENAASRFVYNMAYDTDTFGQRREFTTFHGNTVSLKGGDYGWVIDKEATTQALIESVRNGVTETREPVYLYTGKERASNDIGGTYVEVSISEQRMWCYKDGKVIVDTPVVTGLESDPARMTPRGGVWAIDAKKSPSVLTSDVYGYRQPVTFWMPFNGDVGIHDLERSGWGGDVYLTNGSHGCVNTPYDKAEIIYNTVEIGTPVVVY